MPAFPVQGCRGLGVQPAWTGHQSVTELTHADRQPFTVTPRDNLQPPMHLCVFKNLEQQEEAHVQMGTTRKLLPSL